METQRRRGSRSSKYSSKLSISALLILSIFSATFLHHCDARKLPRRSNPRDNKRLTVEKHYTMDEELVADDHDLLISTEEETSNTQPYGSSPFSFPPFDPLAPNSLPAGNVPIDCLIPPPAAVVVPPSPGGDSGGGTEPSVPIAPTLPGLSPPSITIPSPPSFTIPSPSPDVPVLNPPLYSPIPPTGDVQPSPPTGDILPSPPTGDILPSPPSGDILPSPPAGDILPSPPPGDFQPSPPSGGILPSPPSGNVQPSPPFGDILPSPPAGDVLPSPSPGNLPNPPSGGILPTPPSISVPSPPSVFVPSPPVFQPPEVYPGPPPSPRTVSQGTLWCVVKPSVPDPIILEAMNYACGSGANCAAIQPTGACFDPNNLFAHASYAFNSYWQRTKVAGGTCSFGGTAILVTVDPSHDGCQFEYH